MGWMTQTMNKIDKRRENKNSLEKVYISPRQNTDTKYVGRNRLLFAEIA
jgi:hypothetical protein